MENQDEDGVVFYAVWDDDGTIAIGFRYEEDAQDYLRSLFVAPKDGDPDEPTCHPCQIPPSQE